MLICHHEVSASDLCYLSSDKQQNLFLFLSLNEKETKLLNVTRIRCAGGVCVNQCGLALSAAKARGGGAHLTWSTMTLQNSWCLHNTVWWWEYDGIHCWLSIKNQTPGTGDVCALSTFQVCHTTLIPQLLLTLLLGHPTKSARLSTGMCSAPTKCKEKHKILDQSWIALC